MSATSPEHSGIAADASQAGSEPASTGSGAPLQIAAIWAQTVDGVIGDNGTMPWHVPEDFAHFKETTTGHPVIMGRRTWESFPAAFRPLPGRTNIVITSRPDSLQGNVEPKQGGLNPTQGDVASDVALPTAADSEGTSVVVVDSYRGAVAAATRSPGADTIWVIGGGQLYRRALEDQEHPLTRAVVSVLQLETAGDTRAPQLGPDWHLVSQQDRGESRTGVHWGVQHWRRDTREHD